MGEDSCSGLRLTRAVRRAWGHQRKDLVALGGRSHELTAVAIAAALGTAIAAAHIAAIGTAHAWSSEFRAKVAVGLCC